MRTIKRWRRSRSRARAKTGAGVERLLSTKLTYRLPRSIYLRRPFKPYTGLVFDRRRKRLLTSKEIKTVKRIKKLKRFGEEILHESLSEFIDQVPPIQLFHHEDHRPPAKNTICQRRDQRRQVMFAAKVAGYRGRAPGRGGSYRRREESNQSCRRS